MKTNQPAAGPSTPVLLSTLWVFIMFNMIFADILSFMYPGFLSEVLAGRAGGVQITPGFLLFAAILTEIPIAMIVLSRVLNHTASRWANIVAAVVTIAYVAGGSSTFPHGIFFTVVQVGCALAIIWRAWSWRSPEASTIPTVMAGAERDMAGGGLA